MAQTELPGVVVTAKPHTTVRGGYEVSGDFKVDPRMPYVVFAAQPLVAGDILKVQPIHLGDDAYLVLQECASPDCSLARVVRVWSPLGSTAHGGKEDQVRIQHENKYFLWLKKLPGFFSPPCFGCSTHYGSFKYESPPLVLVPTGTLAAYAGKRLELPEYVDPIPVESHRHDGTYFHVTYAGGTRIRVQRLRAVADQRDEAQEAGSTGGQP
ncbi:hypothetical protein ASD72_17720 [Pseudoxanthomonas sp. Root630]|nr:hypothetical protein ASD72_17720 [Pseudoxanthomonas sp. Root630]